MAGEADALHAFWVDLAFPKGVRRLLEHVRPQILLGLTATPERSDQLDVLEWFGGRTSAEIRLPDAINRRLLCPFQYFGIADSVDLIIQVKRLRDGSRRVTNVTEVIGMEGPVIVTQELFKFEYLDESADGKIIGEYRSMGLRPYTLDKAKQFGFDQAMLEACL